MGMYGSVKNIESLHRKEVSISSQFRDAKFSMVTSSV